MSDRNKIINDIVIALQRYRSMATEMLDDETLAVAKEVQPVSLGDDLLPILSRMADQEEIKGSDFYNVVFLVHRHSEIKFAYDFYHPDSPLPEPNIKWLTAESP